ncbi:MAG: oligosaccharide flippase family protein [Methanomassiliicoccus sp.]|nr:oligosaccharide flippase family protein [Methanomassiliicoccus sp.]
MFSDNGGRRQLSFAKLVHLCSWKELKKMMKNPFYSNSIYIILSTLVSNGIGLIFWIVAAQYYPEDIVGLATVLISLSGLVVTISRMGLDQSLVRFFPCGDQSKIFSTSLIVTTATALLMGAVLIGTTSIWSPTLSGISMVSVVLFLLLVLFQGGAGIVSNAFIALRKAKFTLTQNIIMGSRLLLLVPFITFGVVGILLSWVVSFAISVAIALYLLFAMKIELKGVDRSFLKSSFRFSTGNYISGTLSTLPGLILPILVLNELGAGASANYYIASSFAAIASIIPNAFNTSLFVEGSHGEDLKRTAARSLVASIGLLIPVTLGVYLGGGYLLGLLGKGYATEGLELLELLLVACILNIPYYTYYTMAKIQKRMLVLIALGLINCLAVIVLSYFLLNGYGLDGIGYAWIATNIFEAVIVALALFRKPSAKSATPPSTLNGS